MHQMCNLLQRCRLFCRLYGIHESLDRDEEVLMREGWLRLDLQFHDDGFGASSEYIFIKNFHHKQILSGVSNVPCKLLEIDGLFI